MVDLGQGHESLKASMALRTPSCGMLVYIDVTSIETNNMFRFVTVIDYQIDKVSSISNEGW